MIHPAVRQLVNRMIESLEDRDMKTINGSVKFKDTKKEPDVLLGINRKGKGKTNTQTVILGATEIPFIRTFPSGETRIHGMDRGKELFSLASKFIAHGGRYLVRKNERGLVDLVAVICRDGESDDVKCVGMIEDAQDDASILDEVDSLVKCSVASLDVVQ